VRNTKADYLLRQLVSCRRCGLAHSVRTGERYASYHCRGGDTLVMRRRPEACHARHIQTHLLDDLVWQDVCQVLADPSILQAAATHAQRDWPSSDARTVRLQDLRRQQAALRAQTQRLIDAYAAGVLSLEELRERRQRAEARQRSLQHEERELEAVGVQETQLAELAGQLEQVRVTIAQGLQTMTFAQKRAIVELLIDRVLVDAPDVEIRSIMPLTGLAQRNGVLRARHRAAQRGDPPP
jgi:site-specific DNA recombinase